MEICAKNNFYLKNYFHKNLIYREKAPSNKTPNAFEKYEYEHLGGW